MPTDDEKTPTGTVDGAPAGGQPEATAAAAPEAGTAPAPGTAPEAQAGTAPQPGAAPAPGTAPEPPSAPVTTSPQTPVDVHMEALRRLVHRVVDSRVVSATAMVLLLFALIGPENLIVLCAAVFVGYLLLDRFINVRRCFTLGGLAWWLVLTIGATMSQGPMGPVFVRADFMFTIIGFFLAVAVCAAFFAGRTMYERGLAYGKLSADRAIAAHIVDRLVEHPDEWSHLDGDYLEVESALGRVRDRERAVQQALRDESSRKDDLVTYLAHDLKTPLASVVGYLSLLEEAPDLPEKQRVRFTGVALDKAHRLDALIEEFFDITRFDFHDIVLTRGYVDLGLMLAQVADEFYPILSEQGKTAEVEAPTGLTVLVDGDKMARVFNNVMKNAVAYSYEGSTIHVSAERAAAGVVIRFENQGDPIPAPKLNVIFEKFYRLDAARATNHGGAGLGLAIAKEIVTAHGGQIYCESTPEHTVFTIELPDEPSPRA